MKKLFLIVALAFVATVGAFAQENSKLNLKAGFGLSSLTGSDSDGSKTAISYKLGLGYDFSLSESFAIEPSLFLSNKAYKEEGIDGTVNRFYVELPILAAYKISLGDEMKLVVNAGPYIAYGLFGSDIEVYGNDAVKAFDVFEKFDFGVQAGVKLAFNKYFVGVDYSRAFTKAISDAKVYNQGFNLNFGYSF